MPPASTEEPHASSRLSTEPVRKRPDGVAATVHTPPDNRSPGTDVLQVQVAASPSSYLSALREIDDIAVPDLAATLTNPAEDDDANEANVSFLRTPVDPQGEWRAQNAESFQEHRQRVQSMSRQADILGRDDRARRERLQRVLARLNRLHDPAYGDRIPSHNTLYDWSPASEGEDEEAEFQSIRRELRRQQPNTHPEVLRVLAQTQLDAERERRSRAHTSRFVNPHPNPQNQNESSLRSAAILQAVRRHPRFSARSRDYQRYIMDRSDRYAVESDEFEPRAPEESRPTVSLPPIPSRMNEPHTASSHHTSTRPRMRRAVLQDPARDASGGCLGWLGQTITYLASLRTSTTYEDVLSHAVDAGFVTKEFFGDRHEDFVLDINSISPTFETSLLAPGTVLEGQQRANPDIADSYHSPRRWEQDWRVTSSDPRRSQLPRLALDDPSRTSNVPPYAQRARRPGEKVFTSDSWPVRVTIHAVDYQQMTLAATMEAYDVPSHPPDLLGTIPLLLDPSAHLPNPATGQSSLSSRLQRPTISSSNPESKKKSITTYLEGEIIDFRTHTLLTETFVSSPENDATYWRKLEPFRHFSDEELVRHLVSKSFIDELSKSYILMRWKERCFVRDTKEKSTTNIVPNDATGHDWYDSAEMADGCGLTISGFYYVCMRRSDGSVEGLYCDPHSSPYQHLTLERQQKYSQFPAWQFK